VFNLRAAFNNIEMACSVLFGTEHMFERSSIQKCLIFFNTSCLKRLNGIKLFFSK